MGWTFSEFLNLIELRSQTWCIVEMGATGAFRIPRSEGVLFYAALDGPTSLAFGGGRTTTLEAGDIAMVLSGEVHSVRGPQASTCDVLKFLAAGEPVDAPLHFRLGFGEPCTRILCGRLKARWPGAKLPPGLPAMLHTSADEACIDLLALVNRSVGKGTTATLTRAAMFIFVNAFRTDPSCERIFHDAGLRRPIAQAVQMIETHPFNEWTVAQLASKVGMGRSNFARRFLEDIGETPMALITQERMKHAVSLLEHTDLKIAEIADRIGYRSESAFSHRFLAQQGLTPGQVRKQRRVAEPARVLVGAEC
jgi:AraC-like DNA-binding protein